MVVGMCRPPVHRDRDALRLNRGLVHDADPSAPTPSTRAQGPSKGGPSSARSPRAPRVSSAGSVNSDSSSNHEMREFTSAQPNQVIAHMSVCYVKSVLSNLLLNAI